jgi:Transcriptional regulator PadR-like family
VTVPENLPSGAGDSPSVTDGLRHGYAIMTDIAEFSGVQMELGTLYGALTRLERRGWGRPLPAEDRRRPLGAGAGGDGEANRSIAAGVSVPSGAWPAGVTRC